MVLLEDLCLIDHAIDHVLLQGVVARPRQVLVQLRTEAVGTAVCMKTFSVVGVVKHER